MSPLSKDETRRECLELFLCKLTPSPLTQKVKILCVCGNSTHTLTYISKVLPAGRWNGKNCEILAWLHMHEHSIYIIGMKG